MKTSLFIIAIFPWLSWSQFISIIPTCAFWRCHPLSRPLCSIILVRLNTRASFHFCLQESFFPLPAHYWRIPLLLKTTRPSPVPAGTSFSCCWVSLFLSGKKTPSTEALSLTFIYVVSHLLRSPCVLWIASRKRELGWAACRRVDCSGGHKLDRLSVGVFITAPCTAGPAVQTALNWTSLNQKDTWQWALEYSAFPGRNDGHVEQAHLMVFASKRKEKLYLLSN